MVKSRPSFMGVGVGGVAHLREWGALKELEAMLTASMAEKETVPVAPHSIAIKNSALPSLSEPQISLTFIK